MGTFRRITDRERVRHQEIKDHVWGEGRPDYDGPDDVPESLAPRWGYFVDGEMVSVCSLLESSVNLAGEWRPVGGIRGFVTPPEHRARGHGRALLRAALSEFDDRGLWYALLWPASIEYYRRQGWGLVDTGTKYSFPPEAVPDVERPVGSFEQVRPAAYERLTAVYRDYASEYELAFERTERWWRERVLADGWTYCWTPRDSDSPDGYLVYTLDRERETLEIEELVYRTERARRHLLGMLDWHEPQADAVEWSCPDERRLFHEAATPDAVEAAVEPGAMGRVVDVPAAIEALPGERSPTETVTVAVTDPLVSENEATFRLESGPTWTRIDDESAAVTLGIDVFSQLIVGTISIETAAERELVEATDDAVAALEPTFPERPVYVSDFF